MSETKESEDLSRKLEDAHEALRRMAKNIERGVEELNDDEVSVPHALREAGRDLGEATKDFEDVWLTIRDRDPRARTWRVLFPCAQGIAYESGLGEVAIVSFDLAAILARGTTTAVRVTVAGRSLVFHMPQVDEEIPKTLVEALVPAGDTHTHAGIEPRTGAGAEGNHGKAVRDARTSTDGWSKRQQPAKRGPGEREDAHARTDGNARDVRIPPLAVVSRIDTIKSEGSS